MAVHSGHTPPAAHRTVDVDQTFDTKKDMHAGLETELKLEKIRRSHQEKENQEMEQLRQRQAEAELELEELKKKREERRKTREEEERRREEEEQEKLARKEEDKRQMKEDIERRRMEAAEKRMKNLNITSTDGDDPFNTLNPISPTFKITERTESLNRSLKKSNSFKKTQRPVLLPKIDDKLEQYTHAIEISSKEAKMTKAAAVDMPSVSAPVASKKNMFEAGEAWSPSSPKGTPMKDADCVKVGVANLINHWVKGSPEGGNRNSPSTPSDVKPGDVLQKKNMWEIIGEGSAAERSGLGGKGSSSGKQYKFVVTGHGKYEKISKTGDHYSAYPNGKSGGGTEGQVHEGEQEQARGLELGAVTDSETTEDLGNGAKAELDHGAKVGLDHDVMADSEALENLRNGAMEEQEALAEQGACVAMVEQTVQESMVDQGAKTPTAEQKTKMVQGEQEP
ncbi:uncharacterized protein [Garra rufa]|uniref:uncharacterized protein n=1 Tax=Garra rufa TaxID=137080 RepID=UPI003CCEA73A